MTSHLDVAKGREIIARWCALAEQRLEYLTELFDSGRWRRFYGEQAFLENIREAKSAVETWRDLLSREASRDNRAIDLSWLGRGRTAMPQIEFRRNLPHLPQTPGIVADQPRRTSASAEDDRNGVNETLSPEASEVDSWAAVLDLATIAARYPLLRNAL
jgi:uncharacterized repeat protein (TIGR03809 family)